MDPEKILLDINSGKELDDEQRVQIVALLEAYLDEDAKGSKPSLDDVYGFITVLGRAKDKESRAVLEKYLNFKDPLTVTQVLNILCVDWDETEEYLERVINFALGVSWDDDEDLRQEAIKVLGEYLKVVFSKESKKNIQGEPLDVLSMLISTFEDKEVDTWSRQAAYCALCCAGQKEWSEFPSECRLMDFEKGSSDVDWEMIESFKKKLEDRKGSVEGAIA